jgi:glycosidase
MRVARTSDLWWKNAVVYCLQVRNFGGDLAGVIERIDHVARLGATCLWLMPFYPSPRRDDGYDITDYLAVDPRQGDLGELTILLRHARDRGLRVILDFVPNHTSDEHVWFREHPERYVWADEPDDRGEAHWTFDEARGRYYLHSFLPFQPDLDIGRPEVREAIARTMGFWLTLGADGFRIDAVPFLVEEEGPRGIETDKGKQWLRNLRAHAERRRGDCVLIGEANVAEREVSSYFGAHADALHLQLGFLLNQRLWLSLARQQAAPLEDLIRELPVPPHDGGWATFLRNHDELSLDKLDKREQAEVHAAFAPEERMRIYGHGIRRRVAPMLGGDGPRLRMAWSLLLALPGTPVVLYGDEIGLGEDLSLDGRLSVRVPMDWAAVAEQRRDPASLLQFMTHLIHARREAPELGWGASTLLENEPPALFAHRCDWEGSTVLAAHNLSAEPVEAAVDLGADVTGADDLLERREHDVRGGRLTVRLDAYGYLWLRTRR